VPKLIWYDDFNYEGPPDPGKWRLETGGHGWGNRELQYYTDRREPEDANAYVTGGRLVIALRREPFGGCDYTSARLNSRASWRYGRIEVMAKLPSGAGTWPAIWMLGEGIGQTGWPLCGEIDIMEHVGRDPDRVYFSLHSKLYNHALRTHLTQTRVLPGVSEGFHQYAVDWKEDAVTFLFDDEAVAQWRNGEAGRVSTADGWPFNAPFYLLLNVACGGGFGGPPDGLCLPQTMEVQYVRVYREE
jgi:beta-glucanase (GH16 family)